MTDPELEAAWDKLHEVLPPGWTAGRPSYHHETRTWSQYAYDPAERPKVGKRTRQVEVAGETEVACVRAMVAALETRRLR